jgi:glucosamine 6-phosphate synthetase-like amidotransferase/phosphosugar isomerase protein
MCAIFGFVAEQGQEMDVKEMVRIAEANVRRGPHAFGFAWVDGRGRLRMYKQQGAITDHLGVLAMARGARMFVGHVRYVTHGSAEANINNHPHAADGGWLVHNGVVTNYEQLVRAQRLWPVSECDSEVLGLLAERAEGGLLGRVAGAVTQTTGNLCLLGLWSRPAKLVAVRRGNPLHWSQTSRGVYLATLAMGLPGNAHAVPDGQGYQLAVRGGKVVSRAVTVGVSAGELWESSAGGAYRGG